MHPRQAPGGPSFHVTFHSRFLYPDCLFGPCRSLFRGLVLSASVLLAESLFRGLVFRVKLCGDILAFGGAIPVRISGVIEIRLSGGRRVYLRVPDQEVQVEEVQDVESLVVIDEWDVVRVQPVLVRLVDKVRGAADVVQ